MIYYLLLFLSFSHSPFRFQIQNGYRDTILRHRIQLFASYPLSTLGLSPAMCFDERSPFYPPSLVSQFFPSSHPLSTLVSSLPPRIILSPYTPAVSELKAMLKLNDPIDRLRLIGGLAKLFCACVDYGQHVQNKFKEVLDLEEQVEREKEEEENGKANGVNKDGDNNKDSSTEKSSAGSSTQPGKASGSSKPKKPIVVGADDLLVFFVLIVVRNSIKNGLASGNNDQVNDKQYHKVKWLHGIPIFGRAEGIWASVQQVEDYMAHKERFLMSGTLLPLPISFLFFSHPLF